MSDLLRKLDVLKEAESNGVSQGNAFEFVDVLDEIGVEHDIESYDANEVQESFDESLDETHEEVNIAGLSFSPSEIFKSAGDADKRMILNEYIDSDFFTDDDGRYLKKDEVEAFELDDNILDDVKSYVIEEAGFDEDSRQAEDIQNADNFADLHKRYQITQDSNELVDAISEVRGEKRSEGLENLEANHDYESQRQSKSRKI